MTKRILFASFVALAALGVRAEERVLHSFHKKQLSDKFYSEGAHYGDFNHDGKMDIVSGPYWYAGPEFTERHEYYPAKPYEKLGYSENFFAFTHDFNADGWTDILIVGFPAKEAVLYLNPQGKEGHWQRHDVVDFVGNESPTLMDLTGDKAPELVFIHKGRYAWATADPADPTKPWTIHTISPVGNLHHFTHGMGVGDINADGRPDLIEKDGWWEQPANAQAASVWKHHPTKFGENGGAQIFAYDVDGDGDNDVITSQNAHAYGLAWYEQVKKDGAISFVPHLIQGAKPEENRYGVAYSQLHAVDLVDMDGDGVKDIVTGKRHWAHGPTGDPDSGGPAVLYWYKTARGKNGVDFIPYLIDDSSGVGTQVVAGDVNGDGLPDVVVGNKLGTFVLLHQKATVSEEEWKKAQPKPLSGEPKSVPHVAASTPRANRIGERIARAVTAAKADSAQRESRRAADKRSSGRFPKGSSGAPLNLGLETGNLDGWLPEGEAFARQPIEGDTVHARRADSRSQHVGRYWIGTYERGGDAPKGTLSSATFTVTEPYASYLVGGGSSPATRVEVVRADSGKVIHQASGTDSENLTPVLVDLTDQVGKPVFVRLVDHSSAGWGHINFDDFRVHADAPKIPTRPGLILDQYAHAGLPPEEAAKAMTVPEGFSVKLFAAEPDIKQPIAFTIDERGRLWVAECHTYPIRQPDDKANDRIVILEDTDGDGRTDRQTVFAQGLNLVSGIEVGFGGVFVGAAPYLLFLEDADKDDRADGPPKILLDGWAYQDTHETLNTFTWGPDGWLYGCHGVFTHSRVGRPGTPDEQRVPINAGIWRFHPKTQTFEVFAHGTSNPWGVDFNDHGQCFLTCCVIPHLFHVIQGARYDRQAGAHFNPFTYQDIKTIAVHRHWLGTLPHAGNGRSSAAGGGHAHSGAMIYLGDAWPAQYRDQIFMNNIHGARINEDLLVPEGSGYVGQRAPDFLAANDTWSQILNLRYGPDGQVYMIDWYDGNQCHRPDPAVHDKTNGRVFKVVYGKPKPLTDVDLAKKSNDELIKLQLHPNDWYVRVARRILQERELTSADRRTLETMAFGASDDRHQLRGLWALHVAGGLSEEQIERALGAKSPYVRGWAIQFALEDKEISSTLLAKLAALAETDPSPIVRLYLASAADRLPVDIRWPIVANLAGHAEDGADHNLPLMLWYALEPMAARHPARALELASNSQLPFLFAFTVRRIASMDNPAALASLVEGLGREDRAETRLAYLDGIGQALKGRRHVPMPKPWPGVVAKLRAASDPETRERAEQLAVVFGDPAALARMRQQLSDVRADASTRRDALATLLAAKDPELVQTLLGLLDEPDLRGAALRGLAAYDEPRAAAAILGIYARLNPEERRDAMATLSARVPSARALLDAVAGGRIAAKELSADLVRQLRNLGDAELESRIGELWGQVRESPEEKKKLIEQYRGLIAASGQKPDATLGRAVFVKTCAQCHKLFDAGGNVGPELTGSNRANLEYLLSNVLDPSAVMAKEYQPTILATLDGRVVTGIVKAQDAASVTVVTANEVLVLPKDEIESSRLSDKSMMPDDLLRPLDDHEVRSLALYLASPEQVPVLARADNAASLFNGKDLSGWDGNEKIWSVEGGEIVGRTKAPLDRNEFLKSQLLVDDFRLKLKVKLIPNTGNSGVQFRSEPIENGLVRGYQADIGKGWWGKLYEEHGRGILWDKSAENLVRVDDWNDYEILAVGSRIRTFLNGKPCVDLDDPAGARRGLIALQVHSGPPLEVRFKNLELEIDPPAGGK